MTVFLVAGVLSILFGLLVMWKPKILAYILGLYLILNGAALLASYAGWY